MIDESGFTSVVRRWWWLLAVGTAVAGLTAYAVARLERPTYAATSTLMVGPLNTDYTTARTAGGLGRTYAEVARSVPVLEAVVERTHAPMAAADLAKKVTATSNDVTRLVKFTVENASPRLAASLANALGEVMIEKTRTVPPDETDAVGQFMSESEIAALTAAQRDDVRAAAVRIFGAGLTGRLHMVDPAAVPDAPVAPRTALLTALGALVGLSLAGVCALVLARSARAPAPTGEVAAEIDGVPLLASVDGLHDADYGLLATKLGLFGGARSLRSVAVLGTEKPEGAGILAAGLASAVAEGQRRTLLVDAYGAVTRLLGLEGREGYGELVRASTGLEARLADLVVPREPRLRVLPVGDGAGPTLLEVERARRILGLFEATADVVVLCMPPLDRSPAALVWADVVAGTVVVGGSDGRSQAAVEKAVANLAFVGAQVLGTVVARNSRVHLPRRRTSRGREEEAA